MPDQYFESSNQNDLYLLASLLRESLETSSAISAADKQLIAAAVELLKNLETNLGDLATKTYVDVRIGLVEDMMGTLVTEMANIATKLSKVTLPDDKRYYLSQNEIDFIRKGMPEIAKYKVELEKLKDELIRTVQQNLI